MDKVLADNKMATDISQAGCAQNNVLLKSSLDIVLTTFSAFFSLCIGD